MKTIRAYWSRSSNFGDCLTSYLLEALGGVKVEFARAGSAELFAVGSLLDWIPEGFEGTVLGTGKLRPDPAVSLSKARVLALRGPLTAAYTGVTGALYGDLGLLCPLVGRVDPRPRYQMGVLPHLRDTTLAAKFSRKGNILIDVCSGVETVARRVADCECIVTSSLHGLILADALGIEARWEPSDGVHGGRFKFDDYSLGMFGKAAVAGVWRTADRGIVEERSGQLYEALLKATDG